MNTQCDRCREVRLGRVVIVSSYYCNLSPASDSSVACSMARLPTTRLPTARLPTVRLPTAKLLTARLPTARLPTARLPTVRLPPTTTDISQLTVPNADDPKYNISNIL